MTVDSQVYIAPTMEQSILKLHTEPVPISVVMFAPQITVRPLFHTLSQPGLAHTLNERAGVLSLNRALLVPHRMGIMHIVLLQSIMTNAHVVGVLDTAMPIYNLVASSVVIILIRRQLLIQIFILVLYAVTSPSNQL